MENKWSEPTNFGTVSGIRADLISELNRAGVDAGRVDALIGAVLRNTVASLVPPDEIRRALQLRRVPSMRIVAALHGGYGLGFQVSVLDHLRTEDLAIVHAALNPEQAAQDDKSHEEFLAEMKSSKGRR